MTRNQYKCDWRRWLLLSMLLLGASCMAGEHALPVVVDASQQRIAIAPHWQVLEDANADLRLDQVVHAHFQPLNGQNLGYSRSAYWLKVRLQPAQLHHERSSSWLMAFYWPVIDMLDVWVVQSQHWKHYALGDHRAYEHRLIKSSFPVVPIQLDANEPTTVYVRVASTSTLLTLAELWRPEAFAEEDKRRDMTYAFYFGMATIVALVFLLLGGWLKNLAFISYSGYVFAFSVLVASLNGYVSIFFPAGGVLLADWMVGLSSLAVLFFALIMNMQLLQTYRQYNLPHRIFQLGILFCVFSLPFAAGHYYSIVAQGVLTQLILFCGFATIQSAIVFCRTHRIEAAFYFLAFMQLSLYGLIFALVMLNWIEIDYPYSMRYQSVIFVSMFCMSVGLAYRLRQIEVDKAQAQAMAAHIQQRAQEERRFVAMLSHEFRNPLAAIDRSAQMLHYTLRQIDEAVLKRVNNIRASVSRLSSLVDNFLLSERIESGHLQMALQQHHLADLLADIRMHMTEADWARIRHECDDDSFVFDLSMMSMAVGNLLHNALRYAYPETEVVLRMQVTSKGLVIVVSDAGPGVSREDLAMLGVPYYRSPQTVGKKGTGLGYYFCKRIVELHNGELSARLNLDGGLQVTIACAHALVEPSEGFSNSH